MVSSTQDNQNTSKFGTNIIALTVMVAAMMAVLIGLGAWQWQKVGPKTALVNQIEAGLSGQPIALESLLATAGTEARIGAGKEAGTNPAYRRVNLKGQLHTDTLFKLFATNNAGEAGYHHYARLERAEGKDVFVSLGWRPSRAGAVSEAVLADYASISLWSGVLLPAPTKGSFTPDNDIAANNWYWADMPAMAAELGAAPESIHTDFRIILDANTSLPSLPDGFLAEQLHINIPNNHFGYAMTWWGLALSLLIIYSVMLKRRLG